MYAFKGSPFPWWHYGAGVLAILIFSATLFYVFLEQNEQAIRARDEVLEIQKSINEFHLFSSSLKSAVLAHHRYLMLNDEKNKTEYMGFKQKASSTPVDTTHVIYTLPLDNILSKLETMTREDPPQHERVESLKARIGEIWDTLDYLIELHDKGQQEKAYELLDIYVGNKVQPVRLMIREALDYENDKLAQKTSTRDKNSSKRTTLVFLFFTLSIVLETLFFTLLARQKMKAASAEQLAVARAIEVQESNSKLVKANEELFVLNKTIQESKEVQIKAIIDHALDGQIMMDDEGTILRFNLAASRMFLYSPQDVIGKNIKLLLIEPYAHECLEHFRQHRQTGTCNGSDHRHESIGRRKDGTIFPFDLSMSMFAIGSRLHFSWFLRDITERKRNEADIFRYTKELEKSNQDLDDFAYIASHDLKEPLRGLFNHAQFLLEDYTDKLDDDGRRRLDRLAFLSQRMEHLVNDLLYFSRLGRAEIAIQETDPNQIVYEIEHMIESLVKDAHAQILVPTSLPFIVCDKTRITEVFRNLITNGIKYNDKPIKRIEIGFLPTVNTSHGPEDEVFYVKDNGIGIEEQYFQEIFRIFRRLQKNGDGDQSTGSGLTFVKKIIERHKGHIWLESTPSIGTTFFFNIKTAREAST